MNAENPSPVSKFENVSLGWQHSLPILNTFKQNNFNELKMRSIESYHRFAPRTFGTCNDEMLRSSQVIAKSQHLPLVDA